MTRTTNRPEARWEPTPRGSIRPAHRLAMAPIVGSLALANPDRVAPLPAGAPLDSPDPGTVYGGAERGYVDYPAPAA